MTCKWLPTLALLGFNSLPLYAGETSTNAVPPPFGDRDTLTGDWGGMRTQLSDRGFDLGLEYTGEVLADVGGGVQRQALYQHLLKTLLDFDLDKMTGWKGAQFHVSTLWLWGTEPNSKNDIVGATGAAFADPSNISGYDTYRLYELWLEQDFMDGKVSVRFGQIALDEEFVCSEYASIFVNGTHGWPAFLSATIPGGGEAYPVAGTGVQIHFEPTEEWELRAAIMDGAVDDQSENRNGIHFGFDDGEGFLAVVEAVYRYNQNPGDRGLPGTCKIGGWYHSAKFDDLRHDTQGVSLEDDGTLSGLASNGTPASHRANGGAYFNIDQMLWRKCADSDEGVGAHLRVAPWLPGDRSPLDFYAAGGLSLKGPLPGRREDMFALGAYYAHLSDSRRGVQEDANRIAALGGTPNNLPPGPVPDYELGVEATYQISLAGWWVLQPDFQYIFHPGGSSAIQDAVVIGLRTHISF